jgi:hypothetical protein
MNAIEIEEAISRLAMQPFDAASFPFDFLAAFGNKETTLKRLRAEGKASTNQSDLPGGVLQRGNIHMSVCPEGEITTTLAALRESPATRRQKCSFILATDGHNLEAENITNGDTLACEYANFPDHFGFFLPLAGISTVKQISENSFDIRATGRLNRLYVELLQANPDWSSEQRRQEMNHFMARLIFCFFAEDTGIFRSKGLFTSTIEQMSVGNHEITHEVITELFRAMDTPVKHEGNFDDRYRKEAKIKPWANVFPYVNGGLFAGSLEVPRFTKIARSYLLHVGSLDWTKINPDIFGSMIQAVADDEERGALGMHYTSVPNILKVLNPLFLDDLRAKLQETGDGQTPGSARKLLNLRQRIARIRVFDPACGSGNFLVIAYKEMRAIEAEINRRRGEADRPTEIPLTNFRGIELRTFPAEIARLALIIAEYQCDSLYRGDQLALAEFLPLQKANWITCGNALRIDWLSVCPPTGKAVKMRADDLFETPLDQSEIDFANEGGETYICGNPPYLGSTWQTTEQKSDLKSIFDDLTKSWKSLDYVAGWFMKAVQYGSHTPTATAFVSTNSICQGQQVPILWPLVFARGHVIHFAHTSFKWNNLASHNAGVTVVIVGMTNQATHKRRVFSTSDDGDVVIAEVVNINAYLVGGNNTSVEKINRPLSPLSEMTKGNQPTDGGNLLLSSNEVEALNLNLEQTKRFIRRIYGSAEFIRGISRYCLWLDDAALAEASRVPAIYQRIEGVRKMRLESPKAATKEIATAPHRFGEIRQSGRETVMIVPSVSSESRNYLPVGFEPAGTITTNLAFALYDAPLWNMALIASRIHLVWIGTVCGKLKTDYRYSNTLGWNTFPVPPLTEQNKADLTRCAEDILLARESHFPATIADLYDPENMPANLRAAHERNDETLERIYIGRRFKNDTERLEKLFELYTKMTANAPAAKKAVRKKGGDA